MKYQKGFVSILLSIIGVLVIGGSAYYVFVSDNSVKLETDEEQLSEEVADLEVAAEEGAPDVTIENVEDQKEIENVQNKDNLRPGWQVYRDEEFGFEFMYPEKASLKKYSGVDSTLINIVIEFEAEGSFYNRAVVSFDVNQKDYFNQNSSPFDEAESDIKNCQIYLKENTFVNGKRAIVVEQKDCLGSEGSPIGGSGHTVNFRIDLSEDKDLVYYANLRNDYITKELVTDILKTLRFDLN